MLFAFLFLSILQSDVSMLTIRKNRNKNKMKTNYLNYLKIEHIINMMLALHSDHQEQMRSIINVTLMNKWETIIVILQKNSVKTKDIQKELHKLRVLYKFNERKNNELMLWKKMKSLTEMIEKLMHQRVAALTVNQRMQNQLKRLKKIMSRLEKKFIKKKEYIDSWAKINWLHQVKYLSLSWVLNSSRLDSSQNS